MGKNILVVGSGGLLGSHIVNVLEYFPNINLYGSHSSKDSGGVLLEMQNISTVKAAFEATKPDIVYLPAFISNVDRCEVDGYARMVNVGGVKNILQCAKTYNSQVIFVSSAYVFDGAQEYPYNIYDKPMPIQQYGIQKFMCESMVLSSDARNIVVRTSNIIGLEKAKKNFAYQVISALSHGEYFYAYEDQRINPIHANALATSMIDIVECGLSGLFHIGGPEEVTKFDFALDIANSFGYDVSKVRPIQAVTRPQPASRPFNACLENNVDTHVTYGEIIGRFYDEVS